MKLKYYYIVSRGNDEIFSSGNMHEEEVHGPYTAQEMLNFDLPDNTLVTDDFDLINWKTASSFDFAKLCREDTESETKDTEEKNSYTLRLESGTYLFFFKEHEKKRGPRSAKQMMKLNLDPDTPVTEASLNGTWFVADNFDFQSLSEEENEIRETNRQLANRNAITGLIWLSAGIAVTYFSFNSDLFAGGIVASGAIIWGFVKLVSGLFGDDGLTDEERQRIFEYRQSDEESDEEPDELPVQDLSPDKLNELYAELELTPAATDDAVRKAYRTLAKRYHPDRYSESSEEEKQNITSRFRNITEAYELIKQIRNIK